MHRLSSSLAKTLELGTFAVWTRNGITGLLTVGIKTVAVSAVSAVSVRLWVKTSCHIESLMSLALSCLHNILHVFQKFDHRHQRSSSSKLSAVLWRASTTPSADDVAPWPSSLVGRPPGSVTMSRLKSSDLPARIHSVFHHVSPVKAKKKNGVLGVYIYTIIIWYVYIYICGFLNYVFIIYI